MARVSVRVIYRRLFRAFGPQHWWPAESPFEMMAGAILAQATNWHNVEAAMERLQRLGGLSPRRLVAMPRRRLEQAIRPAGYFRQKAQRLAHFTRWYLTRSRGQPRRLFRTPWPALRRELVSLRGIGPETADSMLLYAGQQPVFVVDAYTRRVFARHRLSDDDATYDELQQLVMQEFPASAAVYNEYHALLVAVGKRFCHRRRPACERCPLDDLPHRMR